MENNGKMRTSAEPNKIYIVQKVLMRAFQNVTFIEFEPLCQKLWAFMSSSTMITHQIWSCHVTLATNFENFYFSLNSILNFTKITKFGQNWLKNKKVTGKIKTLGGKHPHPPVLIGLKEHQSKC